MNELFAWYNLIFEIPLAFAVILAIGAAFGFGADGDAGLGVEHDVDAHVPSALSALGFGRCPAIIVLLVMGATFGGTGLGIGWVTGRLFPILAIPAVPVALVVMVVVTRLVATAVARHLPTMETASRTLHDLVGRSGKMLLATDRLKGIALFSVDGDVFTLAVHSEDGELEKGSVVLITEYDEATREVRVSRDPLK